MRTKLALAAPWLLLALCAAGCGPLPVFSDTDMVSAPGDLGAPSFTVLYNGYLKGCASCHSPDATSPPLGTEQTLDFTTRTTAYQTLTTGAASGLLGATAPCNGVAFIKSGAPATSLALAVVDPTTRGKFAVGGCTSSLVTDEASKVAGIPADFVAQLTAWISAKTPDQ